jgi:hypothetical protein
MQMNPKTLLRAAALCLAAFLLAAPPCRAQDARGKTCIIITPVTDVKDINLVNFVDYVQQGLESVGYLHVSPKIHTRWIQGPDVGLSEEYQADLACSTSIFKNFRSCDVFVQIVNLQTGQILKEGLGTAATKKDIDIGNAVKDVIAKLLGAPAESSLNTADSSLDKPNTSKKFQRNGHVYEIRNLEYQDGKYTMARSIFYVARDDDEKWMKFEAGGAPVTGERIFVTDKEDVYVAGYSGHLTRWSAGLNAHIWRNGSHIYFGDEYDSNWKNYRFTGIYVDEPSVGVLVSALKQKESTIIFNGYVLNGRPLLSIESPKFAPQFVATGDERQRVIGDSKTHWQKHGELYGRDRFKRDGHVYRIINLIKSRHFFVARDDDETWMKFVGPHEKTKGESIFVTDNEDVYVVGAGSESEGEKNLVWKNGTRLAYGEESYEVVGDNDITGAKFEHVWVWKDAVFVAGSGFRSALEREVPAERRRAQRTRALMLNGKIIAEREK